MVDIWGFFLQCALGTRRYEFLKINSQLDIISNSLREVFPAAVVPKVP
jgi:hypothetical protein